MLHEADSFPQASPGSQQFGCLSAASGKQSTQLTCHASGRRWTRPPAGSGRAPGRSTTAPAPTPTAGRTAQVRQLWRPACCGCCCRGNGGVQTAPLNLLQLTLRPLPAAPAPQTSRACTSRRPPAPTSPASLTTCGGGAGCGGGAATACSSLWLPPWAQQPAGRWGRQQTLGGRCCWAQAPPASRGSRWSSRGRCWAAQRLARPCRCPWAGARPAASCSCARCCLRRRASRQQRRRRRSRSPPRARRRAASGSCSLPTTGAVASQMASTRSSWMPWTKALRGSSAAPPWAPQVGCEAACMHALLAASLQDWPGGSKRRLQAPGFCW